MSQDENPEVPKKKEPINTPEKYVFGRPTKYTEDMPQKLFDFFNIELETVIAKEVASQGKTVVVNEVVANKLPTFERFAIENKLSDATLRDWRDKFPQFSLAYELCKKIQKEFIVQHGLVGNYNPGFAKLIAINVTDLKDSTHHQVEAVKKIEINVDGEDSEI